MKSKYQRAKKLLTDVLSLYVKTRDRKRYNNICPLCRMEKIQCAYHIFPSTNTATKWDERNVIGACNGCNAMEYYNRGNTTISDMILSRHIRVLGKELYNELRELSKTKFKKSAEELLDMKREIEAKLAKGEY